jgi:hypothetical protein
LAISDNLSQVAAYLANGGGESAKRRVAGARCRQSMGEMEL